MPFAIQFAHSFEHHREVCHAKDIQHIHEDGVDCDDYHLKVEHNSIAFFSPTSLITLSLFKPNNEISSQHHYATFYNLKSGRAPPSFIV